MNNEYITTDTAESAYLIAHGIKFKGVEREQSDTKTNIILVEDSKGQIGELLVEWDRGKCLEKSFFLKYKWLLKQVKKEN